MSITETFPNLELNDRAKRQAKDRIIEFLTASQITVHDALVLDSYTRECRRVLLADLDIIRDDLLEWLRKGD
jgi:hypothetical protein